MIGRVFILGVVLAAGCLTDDPNPRYCDSQTPCRDSKRPMCDIAIRTCVAGGSADLAVDLGAPDQ